MDTKTALLVGAAVGIGGYWYLHKNYVPSLPSLGYIQQMNQQLIRENRILRDIRSNPTAPAVAERQHEYGAMPITPAQEYNPDMPNFKYARTSPTYGMLSPSQIENLFGFNQGARTTNALPTSPEVAERQRKYGAMPIPQEVAERQRRYGSMRSMGFATNSDAGSIADGFGMK